MYKKPTQPRAIQTEQRFLNALHVCLLDKSFNQLSINEIADQAGLERGAFLKRFGSKKQALLILYERYCDYASTLMQDIHAHIDTYTSVHAACTDMSRRLERIQINHFPANRAMHEDFMENLAVNPLTKRIFLECVELMRHVQRQFLRDSPASDIGAFAAAQLLVTLNYNYVLKAMPALPIHEEVRHELIGKLLQEALKI